MKMENDFFDYNNDLNNLINILTKFHFSKEEDKYMAIGFDQLMMKNYSDASKYFENAYMENPSNSIASFLKIYSSTFTIIRRDCESAIETLYLAYSKMRVFIGNYPDLKDVLTSVFLKLFIMQEMNLYENKVDVAPNNKFEAISYDIIKLDFKPNIRTTIIDTMSDIDADEDAFSKTKKTIAEILYYLIGGEDGCLMIYEAYSKKNDLLFVEEHFSRYDKELFDNYRRKRDERNNHAAESERQTQQKIKEMEIRNKFKLVPLFIIGFVVGFVIVLIAVMIAIKFRIRK